MSQRRYAQINAYEAVIMAMREVGKIARKIADELGVERRQRKWLVN